MQMKVMDKIVIKKIKKECFQHKGFDNRGCMGTNCGDSCCRWGADFDEESMQLVYKNRLIIEKLIKRKLDLCFLKRKLGDSEFLGGNALRSRIRNGFCVFHNQSGKGCVLFALAYNGQIPQRAIPSICRLYPLTWNFGHLEVYKPIEKGCNTIIKSNKTGKSIMRTQKQAVEDIFSFIKNIKR